MSLFGGPSSNQSNQNSGALFGFNPGNTNQNPTQNSNNQQNKQPLFGGSNLGNTGTSLFGGQQNQSNNQTGGTSLFGTGQGQNNNQPGSVSLFGTGQNQNKNNNQGGNTPLFGVQNQNNNNQPNQKSQSTNLLGNIGQSNNQSTNNLFGNNTQTNNQSSNNLFGNSSQANNQSTNTLLGQNNKQSQSTSLFGGGQPNNQENKPLFGAPQNQNQENKPQTQGTGSLFGSQPQANSNPQQSTSLFGNVKKEDKPQGGQGTSLFGASNQQPQQGTALFGQKPPESSTTSSQPNGNAGTNEQQKKQEESKPGVPGEKLPLKPPTTAPNEVAQLDNLSLNYLYKRTMDETVTQWRNELDFQSTKMKQLTDIYRDFEGKLFNNYDSIMSMSYYRQRLQNDSDTALTQLKDINSEEDQIIEQLLFMDKSLTKYLDETEKFYPYEQDKESQLYNNITKITKEVDEIGDEIAKANSKVEVKEDDNKTNYKDDNYGFNYENEPFHEKIFIDKKEMNDILNSFYVAVRAIKTMEGNLTKKLQQVEMEINEKKQEVTYGNNVNMNYNYNNNGY